MKNNRAINPLLILTSLLFSRATFLAVHDPEGPNLLIVSILALCIYVSSKLLLTTLIRHVFGEKLNSSPRRKTIILFAEIMTQITVSGTVAYLFTL